MGSRPERPGMVLLVPFDGGALSRTALERAVAFSRHTDDPVVVLTVVPRDAPGYARDRGWLGPDQSLSLDRVRDRLEPDVSAVAPEATYRVEYADETELSSLPVDIARRIREVAHEVNASTVFVGSENAGRVSTPIASVGTPVSEDPDYDVHIVRHADR